MSAEEAAEIEGLLDHTEDPAESEAAGGAADESIEVRSLLSSPLGSVATCPLLWWPLLLGLGSA